MTPLITILASLSLTAHAYTLETVNGNDVRWPSDVAVFEATDVTPGDSRWSAMADAVEEWNRTPMNFTLALVNGDDAIVYPNYRNEIAYLPDGHVLLGTAPGRRIDLLDADGNILEADIVMRDTAGYYTESAWKTNLLAYGGAGRASVNTLLHELGHAVGLQHEADVYNIMGDDRDHTQANGSYARSYPGSDAGWGAVALYGAVSVREVAVTHFKYDNADDGDAYSDHQRTRVYDPSGRVRPVETIDGEPVYKVWPGSTVSVEFTYENLGNMTDAGTVDFYLSGNDYITVWDTWLASANVPLSAGVAGTFRHDITIPAGQAVGRYSVGPILSAAMGDSVAGNNATYVDIEVVSMWSACSAGAPCGHREGDCDSDSECTGGTVCVNNVGSGYGTSNSMDVCELPSGHGSFCSVDAPCLPGEGDCDSDAECLSGVCNLQAGVDYCQ